MKQDVNYIKHHKNANIYMVDKKLSSTHISIYNALFLIWNECDFDTELSINRNDVMKLAKVGSPNTYTNCLKELDKIKMIKYKPSFNPLIGSLIIMYRYDNSNDKGSVKSSSKGSSKGSGDSSDKSSDTLYKHLNKETLKLLNSKTYSDKINKNLFYWLGLDDSTDNKKNNTLLSEIKISELEDFEVEYFEIAKAFQELFIKNLEDNNAPTEKLKKVKFKEFTDPIRLMMKNEGATKEQFQTVFKFLSNKEETFWKPIILSTVKLRKNFNQLLLKSKNPNGKQNIKKESVQYSDNFKREILEKLQS